MKSRATTRKSDRHGVGKKAADGNQTENNDCIHTELWEEIAEADNPFVAAICRCAGYDVYGDVLGKASWIEYLYLLFQGEQPDSKQALLLNGLAVAVANPGPRDCSVQAAMSAGAGGSTLASSLMAALAVGAGNLGGAREVYETIILWERCGRKLECWCDALNGGWKAGDGVAANSVWPEFEHPPGFDPYGERCAKPVRQTLDYLAQIGVGRNLSWLREHRVDLQGITHLPLSLSGVAAAAFVDLGFEPQQGEMLYLLLRLPGAAAHALEQHWQGCHNFPFFRDGINLNNDPGAVDSESRLRAASAAQ